ncbi:Protein cornichon [Papilio xuthus]|uniref:Protein cornichon n=1 Tax=Papilio xuthus TaxID=66420 RepID=A0A194PJL3_PAPXU|nr:Protein cornichon [Papilio xuthus]
MAFSFPAFSYIIALIVDAFLIFFSIFHVIAFDELKTDYKNPIDQCNSLNPLVLPEYLLHLLINLLFLLSGEWFSLFLNVPLILYHIHRYRTRPVMSGPGLYDPTSIMNADVLTICQREGWIKLAFYLLSFFFYLYGYNGGRVDDSSPCDTVRETCAMCTRLLLAIAAIIITDANAARILGLFPHTGKSHQMVFEPLLRTLAERGHHVTTVSFFPLKNPPANYTDVSLEGIAGLGLETFDLSIYESPNLLLKIPIVKRIAKQLMEFHPLAGMALNVCGKALDWPPLIEALKGDYDVVLVENFNSDCMLGLLHVYGIRAPVVALLSCNILPWSGNRIGVLDNPAFVPVLSTPFTSRMTFAEKVENTFIQLYHNFWFYYAIQVKERELIEKRFGMKIPDLYELGKNYSLMMVNTFHALNGVRLTVPGVVEVGGMHLDHTRKVIPPVSYFICLINANLFWNIVFKF